MFGLTTLNPQAGGGAWHATPGNQAPLSELVEGRGAHSYCWRGMAWCDLQGLRLVEGRGTWSLHVWAPATDQSLTYFISLKPRLHFHASPLQVPHPSTSPELRTTLEASTFSLFLQSAHFLPIPVVQFISWSHGRRKQILSGGALRARA